MSNNNVPNASALEFLYDIDDYVRGYKHPTHLFVPHIVHLPLFKSRKLRARLVNKVVTVPLRLVRKSTMDYWNAQKQIDFKQTIDIENLRTQLLEARQEIEALKKRIK